jgi:type VI secretion system protein ImpD
VAFGAEPQRGEPTYARGQTRVGMIPQAGYAESGERRQFSLPSLLAGLEVAPDDARGEARDSLLASRDLPDVLRTWAAVRVALGERLTREQLQIRLGEDVAELDAALARQVDAILHHPAFQKLESSWRGLAWLVNQAELAQNESFGSAHVEVRVLPVSKRELRRDRESAVEFDRSQVWQKVYEDEFGTPGGTPYGLLVTDHEFTGKPDDLDLLGGLAEVAMASFAPLLAAPSASLLGIEDLGDVEMHVPASHMRTSPDYVKWRSLRGRDESRFVGMPLPRVLARVAYDGWLGRPNADGCDEKTWRQRGFRYCENQEGPDGRSKLWMSAVWPLAGVIVREFGRSGWFADIRGGSRVASGAGVPDGLPTEIHPGLSSGSMRGPVEAFVTDDVETELEACGFIPLCSSLTDRKAVFHSNPTLHERVVYDEPGATANAAISSMLQYVLCVSRFAHYLKVIGRDKVGGFREAAQMKLFLSNWINEYVTPDDDASPETRARMPLRAADIDVTEDAGASGTFRITMRFQPHFQIDRLDATLRLVSTIKKKIY